MYKQCNGEKFETDPCYTLSVLSKFLVFPEIERGLEKVIIFIRSWSCCTQLDQK